MTAGLGERLRERWLRRREPHAERMRRSAKRRREEIEEIAAEFGTEELQEFLAADRDPVRADPAFKAQLRERVWKLIEEQWIARSERDER